ncbi:MAG: AAA family ATPase [Proteobacteria bacterium]|nr:AAA family ATPase [Pseudomonadota bacterium]
MRCATCGTENKPGRQFCASCGAGLAGACAKCGFINDPDDSFCGGCGRALASSPAPTASMPAAPMTAAPMPVAPMMGAERRPVSVMFVDLAGYTALAGKVDPEEAHALLARFFALADDIIVQCGGRIDKHIGDNVMALFGAPTAHGDDPRRAVSAAQAIHAAMPALAANTGQDLAVHIGIAVGEVLASGLGSSAHSSYTVIGSAVNLAARLMALAKPGETLVSAEIVRHLDGYYTVEERSAQSIKGMDVPVDIYRVGDAIGNAREWKPIVGRRAELRQISALLDAGKADNAGNALLVRGVPGIGKSHLAEEAARLARQRGFRSICIRILDFGGGAERDLHRQLARALASMTGGIDHLEPLSRALFAALLGEAVEPVLQQRVDAIGHMARHAMRAAALADMLAHAASKQPLLLVIEDIHWADPNGLSTLAVLADRVPNMPIMLLMTSRLDPDPIDAAWRASLRQGHVVTIDLAPISEREAQEMSQQIAADLGQFAEECIARAEGNPLFLEQLLRSRLSGEPGALPDSLQNVVLARLDQLPEGERVALQVASVLGQQFNAADLTAMLDQPDFDAGPMLRRQLLRPVPDGYLFAHALIRDGIYSALTRERRRGLHRKAAALYADKDPILHAEHLDRAEAPEAALAYHRAAISEATQHHLDRAARLAGRGLELARKVDERCQLALSSGRRHLDIGNAPAARIAFQIALDADAAGIDRCRALIGLAACDRQSGDIATALDRLAMAEPIAITVGDMVLLAEINYLRGNLHFARGAGEDCLEAHSAALAAAKAANEPEWLARAESGLGDAYYLQGRYPLALEHFRACVDIAETFGLLRILPTNRCMVGNCQVFQCRFDDGLKEIHQARQSALLIGDRFGDMFGLESAAFILMAARRWRDAAGPAEAACHLAAEIGARRYESITAIILAMSRKAAGDDHSAIELSTRALRIAEETGIGFAGALIEAIRANILGDVPEARQAIERGETLLRQTSMAHSHIFFREFAIDWSMARGDWPQVERYAGDLAQFTAAEPLPYVEMIIDRARLLARLQRDQENASLKQQIANLSAQARAVDFRLSFPV